MEGIDYNETFSPIARMESIKILLALACHLKFKLYQMDVKTALWNGFLKEDVYMAQPKGFIDPHFLNHVLYLKKALYGFESSSGQQIMNLLIVSPNSYKLSLR